MSEFVEMSWDPITRIVGSLGVHTTIDTGKGEVAECRSTSSIFRGYSVFLRGKDPRDAHVITSRICGICGDNHATCSVYAQNMAYGARPPHLAEWIINLGEAAEFMFDHCLYQENLVGVDFCEQMVARTNPSILTRAETAEAPNADVHGMATIADIMRALNPFEGAAYNEALQMSRLTREMFVLMEGRHVHPSTIYPGGVGTVPSVQLFNDYLTRLLRYIDYIKRVVPMHDDLFDFFYEAAPGYEEVGRRRVQLGCWGAFQDPNACTFAYGDMTDFGRRMFVTPGVVIDGELVTTDLIEINRAMRILVGRSFYDDWVEVEPDEVFVTHDPLGHPIDPRHPWNQTTIPRPQKRDFDDAYSWVVSPRYQHGDELLALDTGGGPLARLWVTALADMVDFGGITADGEGVDIHLPRTHTLPDTTLRWTIPRWSNTLERNRARSYFQAYAAAAALHFVEQAQRELRSGHRRVHVPIEVPDEGVGVGFTEAVRGVLSHHMVIRQGRIANYHPYPPTSWNASPQDQHGTWGPYEDAVRGTPLFEEATGEDFTGIDIMRTVRSFDPCLPCGVHMVVGGGRGARVLRRVHDDTSIANV